MVYFFSRIKSYWVEFVFFWDFFYSVLSMWGKDAVLFQKDEELLGESS